DRFARWVSSTREIEITEPAIRPLRSDSALPEPGRAPSLLEAERLRSPAVGKVRQALPDRDLSSDSPPPGRSPTRGFGYRELVAASLQIEIQKLPSCRLKKTQPEPPTRRTVHH